MAINPYGKRSGSDLSRSQDLISTYNKKSGEIKNITPDDLFATLGPSPYGGLYTQTAQSTPVVNTTVETSIINGGIGTLTVPENGFQVGDTFKAYLSGPLSALNNNTIELHTHAVGPAYDAILFDSNTFALSGTTNKDFELQIWFTIRSIGPAGVASIYSSGKFLYNKDANNNPERLSFSSLNNTTFDTTKQNTLYVSVKWGTASPSNSIATEQFVLSKLF